MRTILVSALLAASLLGCRSANNVEHDPEQAEQRAGNPTSVAPWARPSDTGRYELTPANGQALPAYAPGAHIDVHLPNGIVRQYSLLAAQPEHVADAPARHVPHHHQGPPPVGGRERPLRGHGGDAATPTSSCSSTPWWGWR